MQTYVTTPFADDFVFLEGPRWHAGRLWVSDIWGHTVYAIAADGTREAIVEVPGRPSGLGFLADGTPLVVAMTERRLYRVEAGALVLHADLARLVAADLNDMVVDASGRAWVGNMGYDLFGGGTPRRAEITLVEPDGRCRHVAGDLDFPNGLLITDGGRTLVVAESFGHRVSAFDLAADGSLANRRVLCELPELVPDGICLDQAGNVWVAGAMGGAFVQVAPDGRLIARIAVAPRAAIACQLGGVDGRTLFCLTYDGGVEELSRGEPGAHIETARVAVAAAGSP
ncbi:MAG: SMP-30/gluconolactonase/LRE family protein [Bauldia litoralis]